MLTPLKYMAHVLLLFSISIVQAQSSLSSSMLCYISADNSSHSINAPLVPTKPYTITCSYNDADAAIPKYIQFSCNGGSTLVTIDIQLTDGVHQQKISKDISILPTQNLYEIPVLAYVSDELMQNGKARISSIVFSNKMNAETVLSEVNFSNSSNNYEVKMNQVFSVDLTDALLKNYLIKSSASRDININLYNSTGTFSKKIATKITNGDNLLHFKEMNLQPGKYVVVISENNTTLKNTPNSNITVMN